MENTKGKYKWILPQPSPSPALVNNVIYITNVKIRTYESHWYTVTFTEVIRTSE